MDKETFRKTERMLKRYYYNLRNIESLRNTCNRLERQKEEITRDIKETNISLPLESISISYSDKVQTSNKSSYCDRAIEHEITKLINERKMIIKRILKNKAKIRQIENEIEPIRDKINRLLKLSQSPEEIEMFIELKYKKHKTIPCIAAIMYGGAKATAYRRNKEILESINQFDKVIS